MTHITLVRHGQANSASQDELGYDRLSPLGHIQAEWLGVHLGATNQMFDSVYSGTLRRHVETANAMDAQRYAQPIQDARLNELAYFDLSQRYFDQTGLPIPSDRDGFVMHLPRLFTAWRDGKITDVAESFAQFEDRVNAVIEEIAARSDRALVVTSGGLIGLVTRQVLGLDMNGFARMSLAIMNTSTHHLIKIGDTLALTRFNAISHLEEPGRHHAQTHI